MIFCALMQKRGGWVRGAYIGPMYSSVFFLY